MPSSQCPHVWEANDLLVSCRDCGTHLAVGYVHPDTAPKFGLDGRRSYEHVEAAAHEFARLVAGLLNVNAASVSSPVSTKEGNK